MILDLSNRPHTMEQPTNQCRNIHLLITPLSCYYDRKYNKLDIKAKRDEYHRVPFKRLQHWAIQVGDDDEGTVYEVTSYNSKDGSRELCINPAQVWREGRAGRARRKLFIAVTGRTPDDLSLVAKCIWDKVLEDQYQAFSRNCQSFAELFKEVIENDELLSEEAITEIDEMPSSFNPLYAVLHLSQAKAAAVKLSKKVVGKGGASSKPSTSRNCQGEGVARLPTIRNDRWRQTMNEVSKQREIKGIDDFRKVVETANHLHRLEKQSPKKADSKLSLTSQSE